MVSAPFFRRGTDRRLDAYQDFLGASLSTWLSLVLVVKPAISGDERARSVDNKRDLVIGITVHPAEARRS